MEAPVEAVHVQARFGVQTMEGNGMVLQTRPDGVNGAPRVRLFTKIKYGCLADLLQAKQLRTSGIHRMPPTGQRLRQTVGRTGQLFPQLFTRVECGLWEE